RRDSIERVGLEDVDAGVDRVGRDLLWIRLLEKAADVRLGVYLDEPVRGGIVDGRQHDGRPGLALTVQRDDRLQIDFRQDVAVEDDDGVAKGVGGKANRAGGAKGRRFHHVAERQAAVAAVA